MQDNKPFWITANQLTKLTGIHRNELLIIRSNNHDFWKPSPKGGYLYDVTRLPDALKKKTETV